MKPTYFDAKGNPIETITSAILDYEQIAEEARYDGFNALATGLGDDPCQIIRVNSYRWEIEDCFRVEKSDLNSQQCSDTGTFFNRSIARSVSTPSASYFAFAAS